MACEDEQRWVQEATAHLMDVLQRCAGEDPDDPQCRADRGVAYGRLAGARAALQACLEAQSATSRLTTDGFVTFLRVHEVGTGWGGGHHEDSSNYLDAEVIFKLDTEPARSFGFQLRDDDNLPVRQGMLAQLQAALVNDIRVKVDFEERKVDPRQNSFVIRVALLKPRQRPTFEDVLER